MARVDDIDTHIFKKMADEEHSQEWSVNESDYAKVFNQVGNRNQDSTRVRKESKEENKLRRLVDELGFERIDGVKTVTIRQNTEKQYLVSTPDVYKNPGSDTYVVFGNIKVENMIYHQTQDEGAQRYNYPPPPYPSSSSGGMYHTRPQSYPRPSPAITSGTLRPPIPSTSYAGQYNRPPGLYPGHTLAGIMSTRPPPYPRSSVGTFNTRPPPYPRSSSVGTFNTRPPPYPSSSSVGTFNTPPPPYPSSSSAGTSGTLYQNDVTTDYSTMRENDVNTVCTQANVDRDTAILALNNCDNDVIDAILHLTIGRGNNME